MKNAKDVLEHDVRPLVRRLGKRPEEWQRDDLISICREDGIRVVSFHYAALNGKLKELRLPVNDLHFLERILAGGERVDGSSLFPKLFDTGESDLYVVPVYRWAFLDPWADDELHIVCRFADRNGAPEAATPDNVLASAAERFRSEFGAELLALAELEFYLMPIEDLACWLTVARWLIRVIANRHGASVTYLPKLDEGMAGSGMHLHLALHRDGRNVMQSAEELSAEASGLIGGILGHAAPLTGFGNTVAASFLRLVPGQEAPTRICWGRRNRSSLVRVPLSFDTEQRMDRVMNPGERREYPSDLARPTIEYRGPDGSAYVHLLLAAVAICAAEGLADPEAAERARALEVMGSTFQQPEVLERLEQLPSTAVGAADCLDERRACFEQHGFSPRVIDAVVGSLRKQADQGLAAELRDLPAADRLSRSRRLMHKAFHWH